MRQVVLMLRMCGEEWRAVRHLAYICGDAEAAECTFEKLGVEDGLQLAFYFVDDCHLLLVVAEAGRQRERGISGICEISEIKSVT